MSNLGFSNRKGYVSNKQRPHGNKSKNRQKKPNLGRKTNSRSSGGLRNLEKKKRYFLEEFYYQYKIYTYRLRLIRFSRLEKFKESRKRMLKIKETISTERTYQENLKFLVEDIQKPVCKSETLKDTEYKTIFSNLIQIRSVSSSLLKKLESELEKFPNFQISSCFLSMADFFKIYKNYVDNFENAIQQLKKSEKHNKNFKVIIASALAHRKSGAGGLGAGGLQLKDYLVLPIQLIPRYKILFKGILKCTPEDNIERKNLQKALDAVEDIAQFVNKSRREQTSNKVLSKLYKIVKDKSIFQVPFRKFQEHQSCMLYCEKEKITEFKMFSIYLFNDVVILVLEDDKSLINVKKLASGTLNFVLYLYFTKLKVVEIGEMDLILLETISNGKVITYSIMFDDDEIQYKWYKMIKKNIMQSKKTITQRTKNKSIIGLDLKIT